MAESSRTGDTWNQYVLWIVYLNVALYATCFQIQRPLEPFLVEKLIKGDGAQEYARLQSFFSFIQTFGSLLSGRLLDAFGTKGGFLVNFAACALCYGLLAQSTTITILYLSKIPTIFQCGFLCAQLTAAQVTLDGPERVKALGMLTMSYTVGSVLGPTIGGILGASGDYYFGAKLAVAGSILSFFFTLLMPNNLSTANRASSIGTTAAASSTSPASKDSDGEDSNNAGSSPSKKLHSNPTTANIPSYWTIIQQVWLFLLTKVITSIANAMAATVFPLVLKNDYHVAEAGLGMAMSISSACNAIVNGLFLEHLVKWLGGGGGQDLSKVIYHVLVHMTSFTLLQGVVTLPAVLTMLYRLFGYPPIDFPTQQQSISSSSTSYSGGLYLYVGLGLITSVYQYVLATTLTSESTTKVSPKAKGSLLGLEHALFAAARVIAPQMGIMMLSYGGVSSVCMVCAGIFAGTTMIWTSYSGQVMKGGGGGVVVVDGGGGAAGAGKSNTSGYSKTVERKEK